MFLPARAVRGSRVSCILSRKTYLSGMKHGIAIGTLCLLAACSSSDVSDTLGFSRSAPDEFVVVSRPPLSMPPDFNLVPPEPGKQGPRHSSEAMAKEALFGTSAPVSSFGGSGEFTLEGLSSSAPDTAVMPVLSVDTGSAATSHFLSQMGADEADPEIRAKLGEDLKHAPEVDPDADSLYEQLMGADKREPVIDPKGEAERLRANKDAGKKPNEGKVVTEEDKEKSVFDAIW
jgi:hypothetical protein